MQADTTGQPAPGPTRLPRGLQLAAALVGLQALALLALAGLSLVDALAGQAARDSRGYLSAAFALVGAGILALGVRGLLRAAPSARTPVVVLELLALPVSYTIAFQADRIALGAPILLVALVVLYLLFTPPVRAVLDRDITR